MRAAFIAFVIGIFLSSCRSRKTTISPPAPINTLVEGTYITSAGTWQFTDSSFSRHLNVTVAGGGVSWKEMVRSQLSGGGHSSSSDASAMPLKSAGDPWFIYVESPRRIWFFNGSDSLRYEFSQEGNLSSKYEIIGGKLEPDHQIPAEIVPRLPAEIRKLLPDAERKRPSI